MSCKSFKKLVALHAGGDLSPDEEKILDQHLHTCTSCRRLLEEVRENRKVMSSLTRQEITSDTLSEIRSRVLNQIDHDSSQRFSYLIAWWMNKHRFQYSWAIATFLLLLVSTFWLWYARENRSIKQQYVEIQEESISTELVSSPKPTQLPAIAPQIAPTTDNQIAKRDEQQIDRKDSEPISEVAAGNNERVTGFNTTKLAEQMVLKFVSDQEDVVVYWLVDANSKEKG